MIRWFYAFMIIVSLSMWSMTEARSAGLVVQDIHSVEDCDGAVPTSNCNRLNSNRIPIPKGHEAYEYTCETLHSRAKLGLIKGKMPKTNITTAINIADRAFIGYEPPISLHKFNSKARAMTSSYVYVVLEACMRGPLGKQIVTQIIRIPWHVGQPKPTVEMRFNQPMP
jgi:hypothetical protein